MDKQLRDITVGEWKAICDQRTQARNSGDSEYACPGCPMNSVCAATPDEWELPEDTPTAGDDTPTEGAKPRLAEVLGVEVGQKFMFQGRRLWIDEQGLMHDYNGYVSGNTVCDAINHPESIIRAPRLTDVEMERCRVYGVKYLARDKGSAYVTLHAGKPTVIIPGYYGEESYIGHVDATLYPSVKPGDCICVEEAGGDGK